MWSQNRKLLTPSPFVVFFKQGLLSKSSFVLHPPHPLSRQHSLWTAPNFAVCLQVSSDTCGTCITLQFRRDTLVNSLAPAKLTVYPSMASPEAKEAYKQFFHINSLNSSIDAEETAAWRKPSAVSDAGMYCTTRF